MKEFIKDLSTLVGSLVITVAVVVLLVPSLIFYGNLTVIWLFL